MTNTNGSPDQDAPKPDQADASTPSVPTPADIASALGSAPKPQPANEPAPEPGHESVPESVPEPASPGPDAATEAQSTGSASPESTSPGGSASESEPAAPESVTESPTESPAPESPAPEPVTSETETPEAPAPEAPAPETATPESATPESATPETAAPETAAPEAPAGTASTSGDTVVSNEWGRVDSTGEVFVRTPSGERSIGSWKVGEPAEALAFFQRKYDDLVVQVDLLEQRLNSGAAAPDDTAAGVAKVREMLADAHAIGDLGALSDRLDAIETHIAERRAQRRAERAKAMEEGRVRKEAIAAEAESIAEGSDWRSGADRLRELLDEWKALPRLDRSTDDALWRRFSTARTHYTRRRKAHFAQRAEQREHAQAIKERLIKEAEALSDSTDWGPTSRRYRELMAEWKAAGPAPRAVEETLWKRFRAAQDVFFGARASNQAQRDDEQRANLEVKEGLLAEAEALLPITDWKAARESLRSIQERWENVGFVPRDSMRSVESRLRRVEDAIREAEASDWQRTNPEARARAQATVDQLRTLIADLESKVEAAKAKGDDRALREAQEALEARRGWLTQAENALDEFAG